MKKDIGVSVAVLAALAAHGKDFDRATLNAMLDRLAASPEPKVRRGPMAMCYRMAMPNVEVVDYKCLKCGAVTRYESRHFKNNLRRLRDAVPELKGMGLDIALDETPLCHVCTPGDKAPIAGRLKRDAGDWKAGEKVRIMAPSGRGRYCTIASMGRRVVWMDASEVTNGVVAVDCAHASSRSRHDAGRRSVVETLRRGASVKVLPSEPGDHADEIRVDASNRGETLIGVPVADIEDLEYGEAAFDDRLEAVAWVIGGKRTPARMSDIGLIKTFLSGEAIYRFGHDEEASMKSQLPRLRELLGEPKQ